MEPIVSVVLPVHNCAQYVGLAIESVLAQSLSAFELIVIDDGSTDETASVLRRYTDPRIRHVAQSKRGLAATLNTAGELALGRYLARQDADDVSYPERLARQVEFLNQRRDVHLLGTRALIFHGDGEPVAVFPYRGTHDQICAHPWNGFYLPHPTWMGRIDWFRRFRYRVPEIVRAEDQDLLLRTFESSTFACLPDILIGYRVETTALRQLIRARLNLARAEFTVNLGAGRPGYAVLGGMTFLAKALFDALGYAMGSTTTLRYRKGAIPASVASRWREVWQSVHDAAKASSSETHLPGL